MIDLKLMGQKAREASYLLSGIQTEKKNIFLNKLAETLEIRMPEILSENAEDVSTSKNVLTPAMVDRLTLTEDRIRSIIRDVLNVSRLSDPVGENFSPMEHKEGLRIFKKRVPIGVIAVIYESRPNVTIDSACLMIKSGNASILRGGKETIRTNSILIDCVREALDQTGLPSDAIQFIDTPDRTIMMELLQMDEYIDMLIPRGGAGLHDFCRKNSRIPVITGGIGICHLFVDKTADLEKSIRVIQNAKVQRPTVCNAIETILVDQSIASEFIPKVCAELALSGVRFKVDQTAFEILNKSKNPNLSYDLAEKNDFDTEWLSLILGIKVVGNLDEAIRHIQIHSTKHSDGILTENQEHAEKFVEKVNSACVYVNASTRFTDGAELGLGAEIAISTQPLHARGPMALQELTTYKWIIQGNYHFRK